MLRTILTILLIAAATTATAGINPNGPDLQSSTAKCRRLGYADRPELMSACVRAIRADYCGDGEPHATAGTLINLYDRTGIQRDAANWRPEAEWTARGASCVSSSAVMRRGPRAPACSVPVRPSCGSRVAARTVVLTEASSAYR